MSKMIKNYCKECEYSPKSTGACSHSQECLFTDGISTPTFFIQKRNDKDTNSLSQGAKVNHPDHYNRPNAMECIEEMVMIFGKEKVKAFCLCNAWKYRYRAANKNGLEDLEKSDWYMNKYKELEKEQEKSALTNISRSINDNSIRLC